MLICCKVTNIIIVNVNNYLPEEESAVRKVIVKGPVKDIEYRLYSQLLPGHKVEILNYISNWLYIKVLDQDLSIENNIKIEGWVDNSYKSITRINNINRTLTPLIFNPNKLRKDIIKEAKRYLNVPYLWGGLTKLGIDCSGLIYRIFEKFAIRLPRFADGQLNISKYISFDNVIQPADLMFVVTLTPSRKAIHVVLITDIINLDNDIQYYGIEACGINNIYKVVEININERFKNVKENKEIVYGRIIY